MGTVESQSENDRKALLLSIAGGVTILSVFASALGLRGGVWSVWVLIAAVYSVLSSLEGVPAIIRSRFPAPGKVGLLALHLGGALAVFVPLWKFIDSIFHSLDHF